MNQGLNPGRGKRFFSSSKCSDQLLGDSTLYSVDTGLLPDNKVTIHFHLLLRIRMIGAIPLIPLYPCMPICVNSCSDILKPLKTAVYVQMPQQLLVFRKKIVYIHYKNNVAWLGQIAACFSLWRVGFNSRAVCFESWGGWSGKRIRFFFQALLFYPPYRYSVFAPPLPYM